MRLIKKISFHHYSARVTSLKLKKIKLFLKESIISDYNVNSYDISIIFLSDQHMKQMNYNFLRHNYATDVITFNLTNGIFCAEIYVCPIIVKNNAKIYKVSYEIEMLRVIIHGLLHLFGYNDNVRKNKIEMQKKENFYLSKYLSLDKIS